MPSLTLDSAKRWVRRLVYFSIGFWILSPYIHFPFIIPPVSGQVVDAITGRPISGVEVILHAHVAGDMYFVVLRDNTFTTLLRGRFYFLPSASLNHTGTFSDMYPTLIINDGEKDKADDGYWDFHPATFYNQQKSSPGSLYFPMGVYLGRPCYQTQNVWLENCVSSYSTRNIRVPLIPMVDSIDACLKIHDPRIQILCRRLNTYRSAFRHVETIAQVRVDKTLCNQIDQGIGTKTCLEHLHSYIGAVVPNYRKDDAPPLPMESEIEPTDRALILSSIARLPFKNKFLSRLDPFLETAKYEAFYGADTSWLKMTSIRVDVTRFANEENARFELTHPHYDEYKSGQERSGNFQGNKIVDIDLRVIHVTTWVSGNKLIAIVFYKTSYYYTPAPNGFGSPDSVRILAERNEASPNARREFIRRYLSKYPSTI